MSALLGKTLTMQTAENWKAPMAGKGEGVQFSRATLICRYCQETFRQYKGMKRMGTSNIGICPQCEAIRKPVPSSTIPR